MGVLQKLVPGFGYLHAPGHAKMHDPLSVLLRFAFALARGAFQIEDNVLAYTANLGDARVLKHGCNFLGRRLQRLRLFAQPDGFDPVSGHAFIESARDGFNFGKLRHKGSEPDQRSGSCITSLGPTEPLQQSFVNCCLNRKSPQFHLTLGNV